MKRFLKIIRNLLLVLLLLIVAGWFALQTTAVQTWVTGHVADYLSGVTGAHVTVGEVNIDFFSDAILGDVYIEDQNGDSLAYLETIRLNGFDFAARNTCIRIGSVELDRPVFHLTKATGEDTWNINAILDQFKSETNDSSATTCFEVGRIAISNGAFHMHNHNRDAGSIGKIDWAHLDVTRIHLEAEELQYIGDSLNVEIAKLEALERSGFVLGAFTGQLALGPTLAVLDNSHIATNRSDLSGRLAFKFTALEDFEAFETRVRMNHRFTESRLELGDLAYFASSLKGLDHRVTVDGQIKGRVDNLKARNMVLGFGPNSSFTGDCDLSGLPDIDNAFINLSIDRLTTNKAELDALPLPPFETGGHVQTPDNIADLGQIEYAGTFTGFFSDFTSYGVLETAIGSVKCDIRLRESGDDVLYAGQLETRRFDLGTFYDNPMLGVLTSDLRVEGQGIRLDDLDATIAGKLETLGFNGYDYSGIEVNGRYRQKFFDGEVVVLDENLMMDFGGVIDFTQAIPSYAFTSDVTNVDLLALNFLDSGEYSCLSSDITVNGSGFDLKNLSGTYTFDNLTYCALSDECRIDQLQLTAGVHDGQRQLTITSSLVEGELIGDIDIDQLPLAMEFVLSDLVPSYPPPQNVARPREDFDLTLRIHAFDVITDFFLPDIQLAPETYLHLDLHEATDDFHLTLLADSFGYQDIRTYGTALSFERLDTSVYFTLINDRVEKNGTVFGDFSIDGRTETDTVFTAVTWNSAAEGHAGDLNGRLTVFDDTDFLFQFERSGLTLNAQEWRIAPDASVRYTDGQVLAKHLEIRHDDQFINIAGMVSRDPNRELGVEIAGFELDNLNPFLDESFQVHGTVNGSAELRDLYGQQYLNSDVTVIDLALLDYTIGDLCVESKWDNAAQELYLHGELEKDTLKKLVFSGTYIPSRQANSLDVEMDINAFDLHFINTFVDEGVSDINGTATGHVRIQGTPEQPETRGDMDFDDVTVRVDYLNTTYTIRERASIYPDMFTMDNIAVIDEEGNTGYLVGTVIHENFADWNYDFTLFIDESRFLCMNTTRELNDLFYGKAYGQGYINVSTGYNNQLIVDAEIQTGKGTDLALPLEESGEVAFEDFVTFVDPNDANEREPLDLSGIVMHFGLDVTEDAQLQLILDEQVGDIMRGRGSGHLDMHITTAGVFEMIGLIEVVEGNYLFTLKNLVNKEFAVKPGGTIAWYGDPLAADLNLEAIYALEAPLYDVLGEDNPAGKNRVPVNLEMLLTGKMLLPEIRFNVELPDADEITRSRLSSLLSTEEELNRQAFSLLVLRRFVSPHHGGANAGGALASNTLEMLSSQMGLWLSDISEDFDIGINYAPGDEISNEEIAIALSTQLFNERLRISGNFGVSYGNEANQNPSNLIGDLKLEYSITEDGKIRLVVYNETNAYAVATTAQSIYTQGVGVLYQEEFDTMEQFYCGFKNLFRREDFRLECP